MAKHTFNKEFDRNFVPPSRPLEEGMPNNQDKRINVRPLLDELDEREKRIFRK